MGWLPGMRHNCRWLGKASGGADPLVRAGPPGPATSSIDQYQQQADVGVDRGPGGPPHFAFVQLCSCSRSTISW